MDRLILSVYERKKNPHYEQIHLLAKDEKISVPLLRERLYSLDLFGKLVLCLDSELSKLFKEDYSFNDHGIYYDCFYNSNFDILAHDLEVQLKKLKAKKSQEKWLVDIDKTQKAIVEHTSRQAFVLVPLEQQTQKRDYERFLQYESFVDPVDAFTFNPYLPEAKEVILDIETTGLDFNTEHITLIGLKGIDCSSYIAIKNPNATKVKELLQAIEGKTIIGHNLLFDLSWLMAKAGLEFVPNFDVVDTMLLAHVSGERQLSLKHLSMMYGNFRGRRNTMTADESYLVEDLLSTELLYNKFKPALNTFAGKLVCQAVKTFAEAKVNGVVLDDKRLFEVRDSYRQYDNPKYDFNVNSDRELANYLVSNGVPLTATTDKGQLRVSQKILENFKYMPIVEEYLDYMKELTIYDKFIKPYCQMQSYVVRPNIMLFGTETGRLSCSEPNVQQIPKRSLFKDIFRSRFGSEGVIGSIDLDQAELRIAALLSNDEVYAKALLSKDFHAYVGARSFGKNIEEVTEEERHAAKTVNFGGVLYGGGALGISSRIGVHISVVQKIQEWYKEEFVKLTDWIETQKDLAVKTNQITTYFGRTRSLEIYHDRKMRWGEKGRIGVNTAVQSVASDVMVYICIRTSNLLKKHQLKSKLLFSVHDEMVLDIHRSELDKVVELLKQAFKDVLKTPIGQLELASTLPISGSLQYGKSWLYAKSKSFEPEGKFKISSLE